MMSNYPQIRQQPSSRIPQFADYSYFTEKAIRAGYIQPEELGKIWHEQHSGDYVHLQNLHPHACSFPPPHSHAMHEVIRREIEKERIREEVIMSEILRRRAEARREMMMEREMVSRRDGNGFPYGPSSLIGFDSPRSRPLLGTKIAGRSLEETMGLSFAERERLNGWRANDNSFNTFSASHYAI
ncbi:hypothetical protein OROGR_017023 [Orobanche gracilis]